MLSSAIRFSLAPFTCATLGVLTGCEHARSGLALAVVADVTLPKDTAPRVACARS